MTLIFTRHLSLLVASTELCAACKHVANSDWLRNNKFYFSVNNLTALAQLPFNSNNKRTMLWLQLLWSSLSSNAQLNEAYFATCLFHKGAVAIDLDRQGEHLSDQQLDRLRQIIKLALAIYIK